MNESFFQESKILELEIKTYFFLSRKNRTGDFFLPFFRSLFIVRCSFLFSITIWTSIWLIWSFRWTEIFSSAKISFSCIFHDFQLSTPNFAYYDNLHIFVTRKLVNCYFIKTNVKNPLLFIYNEILRLSHQRIKNTSWTWSTTHECDIMDLPSTHSEPWYHQTLFN